MAKKQDRTVQKLKERNVRVDKPVSKKGESINKPKNKRRKGNEDQEWREYLHR